MRVIAGKARRLLLRTIPGEETRPTTDRIKETLFNIIQGEVPGAAFLDLFAGSGGIGIEALSRGASRAVFVEQSRKAAACIRENLTATRLQEAALVLTADAVRAPLMLEGKGTFDIVFLDPPYGSGLERKVLESPSFARIITDRTLIIAEASIGTSFDYLEALGYEAVRRKEYKTNMHVFIRRKEK